MEEKKEARPFTSAESSLELEEESSSTGGIAAAVSKGSPSKERMDESKLRELAKLFPHFANALDVDLDTTIDFDMARPRTAASVRSALQFRMLIGVSCFADSGWPMRRALRAGWA